MMTANTFLMNTTTKGCSPAFMAARANTASPANSAMAMVVQITPAMGSLVPGAGIPLGARAGMSGGSPQLGARLAQAAYYSRSCGHGKPSLQRFRLQGVQRRAKDVASLSGRGRHDRAVRSFGHRGAAA